MFATLGVIWSVSMCVLGAGVAWCHVRAQLRRRVVRRAMRGEIARIEALIRAGR